MSRPTLKHALVALTFVALAAPLASGFSVTAGVPAAATHVVDVSGIGYTDHGTKTPVTVASVGDAIEFRLVGGVHTVTSGVAREHVAELGDIDSPVLDASNPSWTYTATQAGAFAYTCKFHPNMNGVIVVV